MNRNKGHEGFAEMECCICGRVFIPAVEHMYHANGRWCCTWPCYVELKTQIEVAKAAERARKIAARKARRRALQENSHTSVKKGGERK